MSRRDSTQTHKHKQSTVTHTHTHTNKTQSRSTQYRVENPTAQRLAPRRKYARDRRRRASHCVRFAEWRGAARGGSGNSGERGGVRVARNRQRQRQRQKREGAAREPERRVHVLICIEWASAFRLALLSSPLRQRLPVVKSCRATQRRMQREATRGEQRSS